ncbi:hypothetical protein MRB53_039208 [Persea americana]|nr:hypothetical protein MRB53_039208 [Persea americana]
MIEQNDDALCIECTKEAFAESNDVKKAMTSLIRLKAVGPATASLILSVVEPVPFYSDEFAEFFGVQSPKYDLKEYLSLVEKYPRTGRTRATSNQ